MMAGVMADAGFSETNQLLAGLIDSSKSVGLRSDVLESYFARQDAPPIDEFLRFDGTQDNAPTYDWELGDDFEAKMEARRQQLMHVSDLSGNEELVQEWVTLVGMLEATKSLENDVVSDFDDGAQLNSSKLESNTSADRSTLQAVPQAVPAVQAVQAMSSPPEIVVDTKVHNVQGWQSPQFEEAPPMSPTKTTESRILKFSIDQWIRAGAPVRQIHIVADSNGRLGLGLKATALRGVLITDIAPGSTAALSIPPLRVNDMILQIDGHNVLGVPLPNVKEILGAKADGRHEMYVVTEPEMEAALRKLLPQRTIPTSERFGDEETYKPIATKIPSSTTNNTRMKSTNTNGAFFQSNLEHKDIQNHAGDNRYDDIVEGWGNARTDTNITDMEELSSGNDWVSPYSIISDTDSDHGIHKVEVGIEDSSENFRRWQGDKPDWTHDENDYGDEDFSADWATLMSAGGISLDGVGHDSDGFRGWTNAKKGSTAWKTLPVEISSSSDTSVDAHRDVVKSTSPGKGRKRWDDVTPDMDRKSIDVQIKKSQSPRSELAGPAVDVSGANNPQRAMRDLEKMHPQRDFLHRSARGVLDETPKYVESAISVSEANSPLKAFRDLAKIDPKKDFKFAGKGGIKPMEVIVHEPYVDPSKLDQLISVRSSPSPKPPRYNRVKARTPTKSGIPKRSFQQPSKPISNIDNSGSSTTKPQSKVHVVHPKKSMISSSPVEAGSQLEQLQQKSEKFEEEYADLYSHLVEIRSQLARLSEDGVPMRTSLPDPAPNLGGDFRFYQDGLIESEVTRLHTQQLQLQHRKVAALRRLLGRATGIRDTNLMKKMGVPTYSFTLRKRQNGGFGVQLRTNMDAPLFASRIASGQPDIGIIKGDIPTGLLSGPNSKLYAVVQIDGVSALLWAHGELVQYFEDPSRTTVAFVVADVEVLSPAIAAASGEFCSVML